MIGDPSLSDLIDLTTAELSKDPGLNVVERADLDKLGHEQALKDIVSSHDLSSVQFVPADGLVILRAVKQDGKVGVFARLIAVQPGIVLRDAALPDGADPVAQAQALTKEFAPYWPKLAAIQNGKVTALSLLGLRFEIDAPQTREMERQINVLLASRLGTESDTVVLERWRLNDAVFEKSLKAQPSPPFWTGSSLIDGGMKFVDDEVEVTLRVRPAQGPEISISDQDKADQLQALVGRLADKIQAHPMTQGEWQPAAEAQHFSALGKWCLNNGLYDEGAQAIESAVALGDTSRTTCMLQIRAYGLLAYPSGMQVADPVSTLDSGQGLDTGYGHVQVDKDSMPGRLQAALQAINLTGLYGQANATATDAQGTLEDPLELGGATLTNCMFTLRGAYEQGLGKDQAAAVADLRHAVQKFIAQMNPLTAAKPADEHSAFLKAKIQYAAFWHETPTDTIAYYREILGSKTDGDVYRRVLFEPGYPILHAPYTDADTDLRVPWSIGAPWILSWDGSQSAADIKGTWQTFVGDMAASSDPVAQADAIKFIFSSTQTIEKRNEVGARFIAFLQQHKDSFAGPRGADFAAGFYTGVRWAMLTGNHDLRDLIVAQLRSHVAMPPEWIARFTLIFYFSDSKDEDPDFLPAFQDYDHWLSQSPQDAAVTAAMEKVRQFYISPMAAGQAASSPGNSLPVRRHWPDAAGLIHSSPEDYMTARSFAMSTFTIEENKVWFVSPPNPFRPGEIFSVDPATQQVVDSYPIPDEYGQGKKGDPVGVRLEVTPQWLVVAMGGHVLLCSRAEKGWRALPVPPSDYVPRWAGQNLYLIYENQPIVSRTTPDAAASAVSGLMRVDLPGGTIENLVSSRRVPPENALDGKSIGFALDLWDSPDGLMFALNPVSPFLQIYNRPPHGTDWQLALSNTNHCDLQMAPEGRIIVESFGQGLDRLTLVKGKTGQVLLANPTRPGAKDASAPVWDCPPELKTPPSEVMQLAPVMRGNDLCLYQNLNVGLGTDNHAALFYFEQGKKAGMRIPLEFTLEGADRGFLGMQTIIGVPQGVQATDYGLIINHFQEGFWVVPWADIDAYRAKMGGGAVPANPSSSPLPVAQTSASIVAPAPVPAPPPASIVPPAPTPAPVTSPVPLIPQPPIEPVPAAPAHSPAFD